ncbi:helix-turn-helix domain-containing protein [Nocardia sp. NBC_00508]|uniref:helix-turn-helix domain-containing protein n=1 Tax=Nocardia sp. NBC_00508 TaxID=2975992 RepID=UPI002E80ED99|nr:helix-turn-helix domain-containing protein [Nocardia sp. NBC_00508]
MDLRGETGVHGRPTRAAAVAPGRFAQTGQVGLPLRPYARWLRFQRAVELIATRRSVTAAAHGAGFADSAHLTRTCRGMFGGPPSDFGAIRWVRDVREFPH